MEKASGSWPEGKKTEKKTISNSKNDEKTLSMDSKILIMHYWWLRKGDFQWWITFICAGQSSVLKPSEGESQGRDHIHQTIKHLLNRYFGVFSITNGTGSLVPIKGIMNSAKYIEILRTRIVPFLVTFDGNF